MTPFHSPAEQFLGVQLLAATAAHDYEYWRSRLANLGLLLDAVAVALYRLPLLAVPVGMDRRGGLMDMADPFFAEALADALRGRPGFDQVTASGQVVTWGEPMPEGLAPDARRRFQGLREEPRYGPPYIRPPAGHGGVTKARGAGLPCPGHRPNDSPPLPGLSSRPAPRTPDSRGAPSPLWCRAGHPRHGAAPEPRSLAGDHPHDLTQ
ncbi:DUF6302 family protein [Streptomyces avidinii]|uniref:DUF6302 family protein n=1 Tax=Streptomyces avidinii TaxID=1895 RepID=UPI0037A59758